MPTYPQGTLSVELRAGIAGAAGLLRAAAPRLPGLLYQFAGMTPKPLILHGLDVCIMRIIGKAPRFQGRRPPPSPRTPADLYIDITGAENIHAL